MMNWLFTDMDAYFASVEQYLRPELRGRPVGVIPVETESTCVIAASYEAKRHGVKTGTGVRDARRLCPGIQLVKARPSIYVEKHHELLRSVDQIAQVEKVYSIDEWSVKLRGQQRDPAAARLLAEEVKRRVLQDFGPWLSCSIGVAPTRLLAKPWSIFLRRLSPIRSSNSSYQTVSPSATRALASGRTMSSLSSDAWEMNTSYRRPTWSTPGGASGRTSDGALDSGASLMVGNAPGRTRADEFTLPPIPCRSTATCQWPVRGTCNLTGDRTARPPMNW